MQPHEQRVIDEREELADKLGKLSTFAAGETFAGLPEVDQVLLAGQRDVMSAYLKILDRRIARF